MPPLTGGRAALAALTAGAALLFLVAARRRATMRRLEEADARRRPRDADGVVIGSAPISLTGTNGRAVLLLHGFNDTPQSVAYLAGRLHAAGYTVLAPRLPGHGASLREMARAQRADAWRAAVHEAADTLAGAHDRLYLCGQSMGGALAVLETVARRDVTALVLLAPFLGMPPALRWKLRLAIAIEPFVAYLPSGGGERSIHDPDARAHALSPGLVTATTLHALESVALAAHAALPRLMVPTCYVQSRLDNRISEAWAERCFAAIAAPHKRQQWLTGSGHIISADYEREAVAEAVLGWVRAWDSHGDAENGR